MKNINSYLNESKEYKNIKYEGIPVKELYKAMVNGILKDIKKYNLQDTPYWSSTIKNIDASKPNKDTSAFIASMTWISKIDDGRPMTPSPKVDDLFNDLFTKYWDDVVPGDRQLDRMYDGERTYYSNFYFPDYKICNNAQTGPMKELSKYVTSKE